jgi:ABC-2 type transport system permease protein
LLTAVLTQAVATSAAQTGMADDSPAATSSQVVAASYRSTLSEVATNAEPLEFEANISSENVFAYNKHQPKIAMYAAGIAVMFLLFSASGAGGSLLEEREAGTLDRLLCTRLTITQLLAGKWLYITLVGLVQLTVMFAWGQAVFGVDFVGHLPAFYALAIPTAAAAASFALLLAAVCRSRAQLNGVSVIVVLSMSALGGSMIPRYIMSESMQNLGKYTFNGWALDGFKKVFWYDLPVNMITTEIIVLCTIAVVLGAIARTLAVRWDAQ